MPTHVVAAPAKLTTSLRITGVRADGFHLIDAEMVTIDLADELAFSDGDRLEVVGATGLPVGSGDDNLVRRALALVGRTANVVLTKRIPAGAGLGGGSADAAAVLRWAGVDDVALAASLGADVPFCVVGGRARVEGIGEVLTPLPPLAATFTLVTPPFGCSTQAVYRAWDDLGGPRADGANDLEPAALAVEPRLARWRDRLGDATGVEPVLAGSGSTWFVPGGFPDAGTVVRTTEPGWNGPVADR
ncbi:MAG TPA: 4-(cytidine 5'-diphospho)-2-C-methyl-D-erythritol kinase [Aquihabitans sp.]|nr:4-(cytidine 5'-diphospho)-2-C-methyl-D-erythritol kinase [Aquihabitans sp.]